MVGAAKGDRSVNAFADPGIDVVAEQVDSPITIAQAAEKRGIHMIGKDVDIHDRAPKAWLTGVSWNWGPMMVEAIEEIKAGTWKPSQVRGDLSTGNVVLDPFGPAVPADAQAKILEVKAEIVPARNRLGRPDREAGWHRRRRRGWRSFDRAIETHELPCKRRHGRNEIGCA